MESIQGWKEAIRGKQAPLELPDVAEASTAQSPSVMNRLIPVGAILTGIGTIAAILYLAVVSRAILVENKELAIFVTLVAFGFIAAAWRYTRSAASELVSNRPEDRFWHLAQNLSNKDAKDIDYIARLYLESLTYPYQPRMKPIAYEIYNFWYLYGVQINNQEINQALKDLLFVEMWHDLILNDNDKMFFSGVSDGNDQDVYCAAMEGLANDEGDLKEFIAFQKQLEGDGLTDGLYFLATIVKRNAPELLRIITTDNLARRVEFPPVYHIARHGFNTFDIDSYDADGNTALHKAVTKGSLGEILIACSLLASPYLKNKKRLTPVDLAKSMSKEHDLSYQVLADYAEAYEHLDFDYKPTLPIAVRNSKELENLPIRGPVLLFVHADERPLPRSTQILAYFRNQHGLQLAQCVINNQSYNDMTIWLNKQNIKRDGVAWIEDGQLIEYQKLYIEKEASTFETQLDELCEFCVKQYFSRRKVNQLSNSEPFTAQATGEQEQYKTADTNNSVNFYEDLIKIEQNPDNLSLINNSERPDFAQFIIRSYEAWNSPLLDYLCDQMGNYTGDTTLPEFLSITTDTHLKLYDRAQKARNMDSDEILMWFSPDNYLITSRAIYLFPPYKVSPEPIVVLIKNISSYEIDSHLLSVSLSITQQDGEKIELAKLKEAPSDFLVEWLIKKIS